MNFYSIISDYLDAVVGPLTYSVTVTYNKTAKV